MALTTNTSMTSVIRLRFSQNGSVSRFRRFISSFDKHLFPPAKTDTYRIKLSYHGEESNFSKKNFQQSISVCFFVNIYKKILTFKMMGSFNKTYIWDINCQIITTVTNLFCISPCQVTVYLILLSIPLKLQ